MEALGYGLLFAGLAGIVAGVMLANALYLLTALRAGLLRELFTFSISRRFAAFGKVHELVMTREGTTRLGRLANRALQIGTLCAIPGGLLLGLKALLKP